MDLSSLALEQTAEMILKDPVSGVDTDAVIVLYGKDSKQYRDSFAVQAKKAAAMKSSDSDYQEKLSELGLDIFIKCTKDWRNVGLDGKELECTPENVTMLYKDERFVWIHNQISAFMEKRANFMKRP
jgi:hypothetical protein